MHHDNYIKYVTQTQTNREFLLKFIMPILLKKIPNLLKAYAVKNLLYHVKDHVKDQLR